VSRPLTRLAVLGTFARSFLIQGSWNYHTMIGAGFAFAMLPGLRRMFSSDPERLRASVARHVELFNAHPYLTSVALGAALRMEAEGADPESVRRFKVAVRGPLGGLGDTLVWATWLPGVAVLALSLYWLGLPGWAVVMVFLVVYNAGHVGLRAWGLLVGLRAGRDVGRLLGRADLAGWAKRLQPVVVLLLGILSGAVLAGEGGLAETRGPWGVFALGGFVAGLVGGHRTWRPAAVITVGAIAAVAGWGVIT
jgi:mannose PTS system EIID component